MFYSETQPLLSRQYTVHPTLFIRLWRKELRQTISQLPKSPVPTCTVFLKEPLQCLASSAGEKQHALVNAIQNCPARRRSLPLSAFPAASLSFGCVNFGKERWAFVLLDLLTPYRGLFVAVLAEQVATTFCCWQEASFVPFDFNQMTKIFQMGAKPLCNFASGVV